MSDSKARMKKFKRPTIEDVAKAICMSGCARHGFSGCTWDGTNCDDWPGFEAEAEQDMEDARP